MEEDREGVRGGWRRRRRRRGSRSVEMERRRGDGVVGVIRGSGDVIQVRGRRKERRSDDNGSERVRRECTGERVGECTGESGRDRESGTDGNDKGRRRGERRK